MMSFQKNKFYNVLPPKLKTRIVEESLTRYYDKFKYFFVDKDSSNLPDKVFVRKILSSFQPKFYMPGNPIVHAGQYFNEMYFISKRDVLVSDLFLRFNIAKLSEGSFFGEHELLFNVPSQFNYSASDQFDKSQNKESKYYGAVWVFACPKQVFIKYCEEF